MVKLHPASTPSHPLAQILTVQGHPEFTSEIVSKMVDVRSATGIFNVSTTNEARRRLGGKDGSGGEGFGRVGWAVWRVLLQELPTDVVNGHDVEMAPAMNGHSEPILSERDYLADESRFQDLDSIIDRPGPWTDDAFVGGSTVNAAQVEIADGPGQGFPQAAGQSSGYRRRRTGV